MPNVYEMPTAHVKARSQARQIEDFDISDFCALLEADTALNVTHINGLTILQYPRAVVVFDGEKCTSITMHRNNMESYIDDALAELDRNTEAA